MNDTQCNVCHVAGSDGIFSSVKRYVIEGNIWWEDIYVSLKSSVAVERIQI
jgi:hypothetical protein